MCDSALPLQLGYLDVIIYMVRKMAKNVFFIAFKYFFESINRLCFDDFAVEEITELRSLEKIQKIVWCLFYSTVSVKHESSS